MAHPATRQGHEGTEGGAVRAGTGRNPARSGGCSRDRQLPLLWALRCRLGPVREPTLPHVCFLVPEHLVFSTEKHLTQEPGTQPYNVSDDSVPEHKVALLKV